MNLTPRTTAKDSAALFLAATTFRRDVEVIPHVRKWARKVVTDSRVNFTGEKLDALEICVSELATNAVRYGDGGGTFAVIISQRYRTAIRAEIVDQGNTRRLIPHIPPDPVEGEGGRGLYLVELLSTSWGHVVDQTARVVWCEVQNGTPPTS